MLLGRGVVVLLLLSLFMFRHLLLLLLFLVFLAALVSHACSSFSAKSGFLAWSIMCNRPRTNGITPAVRKNHCSPPRTVAFSISRFLLFVNVTHGAEVLKHIHQKQ